MSALPSGWTLAPLADLVDTALGKMLDRGRTRGLPMVPYLRNVNVQWDRVGTDDLLDMELSPDEFERFSVEAGDLLVCEGGEIGRAAIYNGGAGSIAYQKALHRVRSRGQLDLKFLRYLLEHYSNDGTLARFSTGSTIAHLPQQKLRVLPVPLPSPDEQRRIVDILEDHLSRLDAANANCASAKKKLVAMHKSVLVSLIPDADRYPAAWKRSTVAEAGKVELGRQRHPDWHNGSNMQPYLRVANVFEDRIDAADLKQMHWRGETFHRFKLHVGDLLLNEGQSPEFLGRPALYRGEPPNVAFTNSLIRFQANQDVLPEFALLVFRRHMHAGRFSRESRITTNIAHLSATRLKPIEFPVPPLDHQQQLVDMAAARIDEMGRLKATVHALAERSRVLRRALLEAAFSGRLTGHASDLDRVEELMPT